MRTLRALILTAIALSAVAAHADYKQAFRDGVRAYEKKNWSLVVANMSAAIAQQKPTSEIINISGGWNEPYVPYDFLAAALANLGQCDNASKAWRDAAGVQQLATIVEVLCPGATTKVMSSFDYKTAFRDGVRAYEKQQWDRVATLMRAAIEAKPASDEMVVINGAWKERYAPADYLAAAIVKQACRDATIAWQNSIGNAKLRKVVMDACGAQAVPAKKR